MKTLLSPISLQTPEQLSNFLQRLGPVTTKIGQYLALRRDLLPQEYCDELMKLTDHVPAFPWNEARKILIEDIGKAPEQLFEYIDRVPFASGSLAQVHRARLSDGAELAVKIQRPGIDKVVERDLKRLRRLARLAERIGWNLLLSPTGLVDEIGEWLRRELDLKREFKSARRLSRHAAKSTIQRIPEVFADFSSARIVAYEFLDGPTVASVLRSRQKPTADQKAFAWNLVTASLTQLFHYQFFHADLHPGNLLVLPDNVVGFVDFGFCDVLADSVRNDQSRYLAAVYADDVAGMFQALNEILIIPEGADVAGFRRDFVNDRRALEGRSSKGKDSDSERGQPAGAYLSTVLNAARRNGYRIPTNILSIYRALLTLETVADSLGLRDGIREAGLDFFRDLQRRDVAASLTDQVRKEQFFVSLLNLTRDTPRQLNQILTDISDGTLSLKVEVSEDPRVTKSRNRRAKLSTLSLLTVSVAILLTRSTLPAVMGVPLSWILIVTLLGLYLSILAFWRRL